jgi:predicted TIM-barrel fold metal-dependent hydrolase
MKNGYRIIDSDLHVVEPTNFLAEYLEEPYRHQTAIRNIGGPGEAIYLVYDVNGKTYRQPLPDGSDRRAIQKLSERRPPITTFRELEASDYLEGMDTEGLDVAVVFPTHGFGLMGIVEDLDAEYAAALARGYNDWMRDFCSADPKRLKPTAVVSLLDPVEAAAEARRACETLGAVGVVANVNVVNGRQPHDRFYDPLWTELNRLGAPICFHPTTYRPREGILPRFREQPDISATIAHAVTNPTYNMMNLASFTVGGVFERFPNLRAGFLETSASWATWLLWRLDDQWELFGPDESWTLSQKPSEYFRRQGFVAAEPEEGPVKYLLDAIGDDNVVISTDFPHPDSIYPEAMNEFVELEGISEAAKRKILWDNSVRLYDLDPETGQSRRVRAGGTAR